MAALRVLSSMATRHLLAERIEAFRAAGRDAVLTAVGGVDAARRVRDGDEAFDVIVLADDALAKLGADGLLADLPRCRWVDSGVAVAVPAGAPRPDVASEAAVREAVRAATRVGVSTGPSGVALTKLLDRWDCGDKAVQAPPGVPVAALLARGEVDLGFQQLSEMLGAEGIVVLGPLPASMQVTTTFSAAVAARAADGSAAKAFLDLLADASSAATVERHGMTLHTASEPAP